MARLEAENEALSQLVLALRESEERYRQIIENSRDGLNLLDLSSGQYVFLSSSQVDLTGFTEKEMRNISVSEALDRVHPDDRHISAEQQALVAAGLDPPPAEYRWRVKNGEYRWFSDSRKLVRDADGRPIAMVGVSRDVTERKAGEEKLASQKLFYETVLQSIQEGVWVTDADDRMTFFNHGMERIAGIGSDDVLGRNVLTEFAPETIGHFRPWFVAAKTSAEPVEYEAEVVTPAGRPTVQHGWLVPLTSGGQYAGMICTIVDITEQKTAEQARREGEQVYRDLFNNSQIGMFRTRIDGSEILNANEKFLEIFRRTLDEVVGRPSVIHWADPRQREAMVARLMADGRVTDFECDMVRSDGDIRHCLTSLTLSRQSGLLEGSILDITERKQAEQALRASEERWRTIVENEPECVKMLDGEGRLLAMNPAGLAMIQGTWAQVEGKRAVGLVAPEDQDAFNEMVAAVFRGERRQLTFDMVGLEGRRLTLTTTSVPLREGGAEGTITALLGVTRDITERRRSEQERERLQDQLLQARKMEAVGRLAGGVAHDFNNMLQAILGNAELLMSQMTADSPWREGLREIRGAAERSARLTGQLLAFARRQTIAPQILDLNETVAAMLKMLQRLIGEEIEVEWQPGYGVWPVFMDPSQIDQLLVNLCVNARDAIGGIGRVTMATSNRVVDEATAAAHPDWLPGDYVELLVADTGAGMDEATRAHLFEPFYTTKEMGQGTGLGLATVFGIVKQNGGAIEVDSAPGVGTTFRLCLPRSRQELAEAAPEPPARTKACTETLPVVEDEARILELMRRVLERRGYRVLVASSPFDALGLVDGDTERIDLLLTDVVMPGLNGRELHQRLAKRFPGLRCLFVSGYTADILADRGVSTEQIDFLHKPFTLEALQQRVRAVLDRD